MQYNMQYNMPGDAKPLFILLGVVQMAFGMSNGFAGVLAVLLLLAWWPLYFVGCWASGGRTLG